MKFLSNMTTKIFNIILILTTSFSFSQNADRIYYNKNWKETTKENASFYRIMPSKKVGSLFLMQDFYSNNTPQFQGYALQSDENSYVGDIVWYDENGFDTAVYQYYNNTAVPVLTYYYPNGKKRKTIEYKKGRKSGFSIVYHQDGTVLMKGKYLDGKPVEGDFEEVRNWDDYRNNKSEEEAYKEQTEVMIETSPVMVDDDQVETPKKIIKNLVKKKIFWINSKQLAQETWYDIEYGQMHPFKQVNYDKTGKVLQTINQNDFEQYGSDISNGTFYDYYFQNKFAVGIKSKTTYKQRIKSGEEIRYFPNGKIQELTKYLNGEKVGDEIVYDKNETLVTKRVYKNGAPFEGNFDENFSGSLLVNANYVKGGIDGEAIAKKQENDSIVAKGIYKNGKPYNGTFITESGKDRHELIHVIDFKKNGLQKVFSYNIDNDLETYTCVNDVKNGETVFYESGEVTGKLEYKNDLPFEGKLVEAEKATIYKDGAIAEEIIYRNKYERTDENNILRSKYYTNGKLTKIVNRSFAIADKVQDSYEGIYKNEQPYSGYFSADLREFNYIDYYEDGVKKYQYSNNYLENLEKYQQWYYDIKSTYKDGKIVDGVEYTILDHQMISKRLKNGVLQSFDYYFSVAYYANIFHFEMKNDVIEVSMYKKNKLAKIVIDNTPGKETKKMILNDKVLFSYTTFDYESVIDFPKGTQSIYYFQSKNGITAKKVNLGEIGSERGDGDDWKLLAAIFGIVNNISGNALEVFNKLGEDLSAGRGGEMVAHIDTSSDNIFIVRLDLNRDSKPEMGTVIQKTKNNYTLKTYFNAKLIAEKNNISFENLKTECEKQNEILMDKLNNRIK